MVSETAEKVRRALQHSGLDESEAEDVAGFVVLRERRGDVVEAMAGAPGLMDTELLSQAFAGNFHREVFESVPMLSAKAVAEILGPVRDVRGYAKRLRTSPEVIALPYKNTYVYPQFQIDLDTGTLRPVVAEANRALCATKDPWGAMAWWTAPNPRWGGRRPIEHPDDPRLLDAARAEADDSF